MSKENKITEQEVQRLNDIIIRYNQRVAELEHQLIILSLDFEDLSNELKQSVRFATEEEINEEVNQNE